MASYSKKYGKWQARIFWKDITGKKHRKTKNGFPTKTEAKKWAAEASVDIQNGIKIDREVTFANYYHDWYKKFKEPRLSSDASKAWYENVSKLINAFFSKDKLHDINRSKYQSFINDYSKEHSPASVKKTNNIIRQCVKSAVLDGLINRDFTQSITLTGNKEKELNVDYLNMKEIEALLKEAKKSFKPRLYTSRYMIVTAIYTGMRLGEIQALTWRDVDFLHKTININKSWDSRKKVFKPTKTVSSNRKIKMNNDLANVLLELRQRSSSKTMVFENFIGTIPTTDAVNDCLHKMMKKLNINRHNFHFHSLRHSQVAILLANGVDIYAISKRLGHSSIATTTKVYAYLIDEYQKENDVKIVKALDKLSV